MSIASKLNELKIQESGFKYLPFKNSLQPYVILIITTFFLYVNTSKNEIAFDDSSVINQNEFIVQGVKGIKDILTHDTYFSYYKQLGLANSLPGGRYRPLSQVTFAIEQEFIGTIPDGIVKDNSWDLNSNGIRDRQEDINNDGIFNKYDFYIKGAGFRHVINMLLYILSIIVIYHFFKKFIFKHHLDMIFIAILLFAIHPIHTEVVANIKSRDEILSILFIFLTLYKVFSFIDTGVKKDLLYATLFLFLSLLSKEYALVLVFLIPVFILIDKKIELNIKQSKVVFQIIFFLISLFFLKTVNNNLVAFLIPIIFFGVSYKYFFNSNFLINKLVFVISNAFCLYLALRFTATSNSIFSSSAFDKDILGNPYLFASFEEKWASKIVVCLRYLKLMFVPYPLLADYSYNSIPFSKFTSPLFISTILVYTSIIVWFIVSIIKRTFWSIGLSIFIFFFIPVSNLFFDIGATMGERLFFHSSLGVCILISMLFFYLLSKIKIHQKKIFLVITTVFIIPLIVFSKITIDRNSDWKNNDTLFSHDLLFAPNNINALLSVGISFYEKAMSPNDVVNKSKNLKLSIYYYDRGIKVSPNHFPFYLNKSFSYFYLDELDSSLIAINTVKKLSPNLPIISKTVLKISEKFMINGINNFQKGDKKEGIKSLLKSVEVDKTNVKAWNNLAKALFEMGAKEKALDCYKVSLKLNPDNPIALNGIKIIQGDTTK